MFGELGDGKPRIVFLSVWLTPVVLCGELIQIDTAQIWL